MKRTQIINTAMRHFAERGFQDARVGDIADELGIAKGSIFQHFGSKSGLFFEVYKKAVRSFPAYLHAPAEVLQKGFFATLRYWLVRTEHLLREDWIPYRVSLLGNHGADLNLKRQINRFLANEDPYGTVAFVRMGIKRGEVRSDIDLEMCFHFGLDHGAFPGRAPDRRNRSRPLSPQRPPRRRERCPHCPVSGGAA